MEKTVVQFILENIFLFLPIGLVGIVSTLVLMLISKKENIPRSETMESNYITIYHVRFNIYFLVYLFIWIIILLIGLFSNFIIPTIIGGIIAIIPFILFIIIEYKTKNVKVR